MEHLYVCISRVSASHCVSIFKFLIASPSDFPSRPKAGFCGFNVWMLLRLPQTLYAHVFQEALLHHIQSEEPVTSLTFLLDIEVCCRPSSGSQSGVNPTSVFPDTPHFNLKEVHFVFSLDSGALAKHKAVG